MSDILLYFNLIAIPFYCFYRFKKTKSLSLLNPCFYLLIGSYFYLTLSSFLIKRYLDFFRYNPLFRFDSESVQTTTLFCNWFSLVFLIFYIFSVEQKNVISRFKPKTASYQIALVLGILISLILLMIIAFYGPTLITFTSRLDAFEFYIDEIAFKYRVSLLVNILLGCVAVIVWRTKNFKWYLLLLIPIILNILCKGRTTAFVCLVFAYINYVVITRKTSILKISILLLALIATQLLREDFTFSWDALVLNLSFEVILTRFTSNLVYDRFLHSGDLLVYLFHSLFTFIPGPIVDLLIEFQPPYINVVAEYAVSKVQDAQFSGLGGNLVSEALFYGGTTFAMFSPIIIGGIFYCLNQLKIYRTFPGFIFFCFLISNLQAMIRSSFYDQFLGLISLMFVYLIWIPILEGGRVVFVKITKLKIKV